MSPEWTPQIQVDIDLARELIGKQFPALPLQRIERFGHGWDNVAYLVDNDYVFRFPQRKIAAPLIAREIALLARIAPLLPVRISAPDFAGTPAGSYPWQFAGYRLVRGSTASSIGLDDGARVALAPQLGAFLRALHALDPQPLLAAGLVADQWGRFDHERRSLQIGPCIQRLQARGELSDARRFLDELETIAPHGIEEPAVIVHGDLYARHVIVDSNGGLAGVIDWGDLHHGHRSVDLAVAHLMLPTSAHAGFAAAYGSIAPRQWKLARYRAIHAALIATDYGLESGDGEMLAAGRTALEFLRRATS